MVDMSGEQSFHYVLGGDASQRNESDHIAAATIVFPVLIPDDSDDMHPETGHLSLEAKSSSSEQTVVKRKRGRPRKIKPSEEQSQSGKVDTSLQPDQQPAPAAVKRSRPKRSEQTTTKRDPGLGPAGAAPGEASNPPPVKRGRGRPKKVATSTETNRTQSQGQVHGLLQIQQQSQQTSGHQAIISSSEGIITTHASTDIYNAVQQLAQDAVIVSAIHGTPVQVLPTTAVASMNTIDSESPLRVAVAPVVSVTISPTRDSAGVEWTASSHTSAVTTTPPSSSGTTNERSLLEKIAIGYGTPLNVYQLGANTPTLLHAEQPEILNSLPQCSLSSGEVSVKIVDRLAGLKEKGGSDSISRGSLEEVCHDTHYLKRQPGAEVEGMSMSEGKETKVDNNNVAESSSMVIDSEKQNNTKIQEQPAEPKPQLQLPPMKRKRGRPPKDSKRGRPPKNRSTSQQSTLAQEEHGKKDSIPSVSRSGGETSREERAEPSPEAAVTAASDQPVVRRKSGRPSKVKTPQASSESLVAPPQATTTSTPTTDTTAASVNGEESKKPRKRGRPPKSTKTQMRTAEASGEVKVKRGRGRPRKYPIPAVAASGPFLPSVSGITLPAAVGQNEGQTPTQGSAPPPQSKSKQQQQRPPSGEEERSQGSPTAAAVEEAPVSRKRGRPPKNPDGPPPAKRKRGHPRVNPNPDLTPQKRGRPKTNPSPPEPSPRKRGRPKKNPTPDISPQKRGRPRKHPLPSEESDTPRKPGRRRKSPASDDKVVDLSENQQQEQRNEQQEKEELERQIFPEVTQKEKETSPIIDVVEITEPLPKRKRGRPKKIPPVVPPPLQEPSSLSSLVQGSSSASLSLSGPEKPAEEEDDHSSEEVVNLSLQISFSDSDSEHSEKMESNAILALADRVVAPSPSPPRELDSPLLNPSFEESYDEDSDPDSK